MFTSGRLFIFGNFQLHCLQVYFFLNIYTDEFERWWETLKEDEQIDITASVGLLEECGPNLRHPHSSGINGSAYSHMRELRIQHRGCHIASYMPLILDVLLFS